MRFQLSGLLGLLLTMTMHLISIATSEIKEEFTDDYCLTDTFQPRCLKNEVILMKSATYGRMRIGRCITTEEVDTLGSRYIGCSADVLPLLDRKCSGKTECNILIIHIAAENIKPCNLGLTVYLEAAYSCISVADEKRSCVVDVSATPVHVMGSRTCGTKSQPWIVEAPAGQRMSISLIAFSTLNTTQSQGQFHKQCNNHGLIVDKAGKRNSTICVAGSQREKKLYLSAGNAVEIFFNLSDEENVLENGNVILRLQAIGCSDIIPPEDAYLKRNGDEVVVGCYTSRKTWHLSCEDGKWIGVIGNCSQGASVLESDTDFELKTAAMKSNQVLIIVTLVGFTVAICLATICIGAICFRRACSKKKMMQEYKTLNGPIQSTGIQPFNRGIHPSVATDFSGGDMRGMAVQSMPTYSVFVGEDAELFSSINHSVTVNNTNLL